MSKVSINSLAEYAKSVDARPLPSDKFTVTLTRSHLQWLQRIVALQVKTERVQLDYYIKRDYAKHPERKAIDRFNDGLRKLIKETNLIMNNVRAVNNEQQAKDNDLRAKYAAMKMMLETIKK